MYSIGEFSLITRVSVKTLRRYHEEGIVIPDYIDAESGYRYYRHSSVERVAAIVKLREMEFTVSEIRDILSSHCEDAEIVEFLERQMKVLDDKAKEYRRMRDSLSATIDSIKRRETMSDEMQTDVLEKYLDDMIFAGYRYTGQYDEIGKAFSKVGRASGRSIAGPAMALYYDGEYCEKNAQIEGGYQLSRRIAGLDIECRVLKGGRSITILHQGSYETLGKSYEKVFAYSESHKLKTKLPTREIYIKGPGMFLRGNPKNYITEIQVLVEPD